MQHANPYYDDSYAVNSANVGPYGDAIETELIPAIEKQFRGLGQGWARFIYGGSTGGWEALAVQIFLSRQLQRRLRRLPRSDRLPRLHRHQSLQRQERLLSRRRAPENDAAGHAQLSGQILITAQEVNQYELALGTHGRSGEQFDIWQAVYSPVGDDGYPKPIFDKETGDIDHSVAAYWKEHYDLRNILERDWQKLGPKLQGKIHIYCGSADNYFLNNAVYLLEDFLKTKNPPYEGEVKYGDRAEHCWNGDPTQPNYLRACTTTPCTCQRSWNASRRQLRQAQT